MNTLRGPVAGRLARWGTVGAAGLGMGYLLGDKDVGVGLAVAGYLLAWERWPDRARDRRRI